MPIWPTSGHVFATVELNSAVDQNQWGFVAPNYTSYAYLDAAIFNDSLFAVLCMTGDRTGEDLTQSVNDNVIPTGQCSGVSHFSKENSARSHPSLLSVLPIQG